MMRTAGGRAGAALAIVAATLAACQSAQKKQAAADAKAANFVPPSVTSRLDYGAQQERRFHRLDRNGDDVLETGELPRPDSRIGTFDRNSDGNVSLTEFSDGVVNRFDAMDLNHDGTVTSEERKTSGGKF